MLATTKRHLALAELGNVLTIRGEVDYADAERLLRRLRRLRGRHRAVVVDLSEVTYMDSAGFGALLRVCRELRHSGGELILRRPSPHVRRMLEITDTLRFFGLQEEEPAAASEA
ncbi:MAG: STAS domain-containing protein [Armatimonadetes bacterium]|nr:STAS domain-containing protein [Armatimonadota bacterium]